MNWNKILNVFIIFFLCINIGIFAIASYKKHNDYTLSNDREDQLKQILNEKGIVVYNFLPSFYPMAKVTLEVPQTDQEAIKRHIFGEEHYDVKTITTLEETYESLNQEITFYKGANKGSIYYRGYNEKYIPEEFSEEGVNAIGRQFAKDITLNKAKYELTSINLSEDENSYILYYNEIFKDEVLFCSYVTIKINRQGIEEAKLLRFNPIKFVSEEQVLYPIDEVLYKFADTIQLDQTQLTTITDIDLGYDLGDDEMEENLLGEAVPYYRIKLSTGEFYYINAYTNEPKKSEF